MQTFLPYSDFKKSAQSLDYRRLGKQRIETKQIYFALTKAEYGWKHHTAVRMWKGYELALLEYGKAICEEWISRGYKDAQLEFFKSEFNNWIMSGHKDIEYPKWLGNSKFHRSHKSNLVRKNSEYYSKKFKGVPNDLPYVWPA